MEIWKCIKWVEVIFILIDFASFLRIPNSERIWRLNEQKKAVRVVLKTFRIRRTPYLYLKRQRLTMCHQKVMNSALPVFPTIEQRSNAESWGTNRGFLIRTEFMRWKNFDISIRVILKDYSQQLRDVSLIWQGHERGKKQPSCWRAAASDSGHVYLKSWKYLNMENCCRICTMRLEIRARDALLYRNHARRASVRRSEKEGKSCLSSCVF